MINKLVKIIKIMFINFIFYYNNEVLLILNYIELLFNLYPKVICVYKLRKEMHFISKN